MCVFFLGDSVVERGKTIILEIMNFDLFWQFQNRFDLGGDPLEAMFYHHLAEKVGVFLKTPKCSLAEIIRHAGRAPGYQTRWF